jgi:hypothetical protein
MAATSTIAALTLVLAANLTDAAVFPTDDANGNTRKATIAQMRTQLNTGPQIFTTSISVGTTLTVTGASTLSGLTSNVATNTGIYTQFQVGGVAGGSIAPSNAVLADGSTDLTIYTPTGYALKIATGGAQRGYITSSGVFAWGTTVTTGASAGDVVLANAKAIRGVNAGGTNTLALIAFDAGGAIQLAGSTSVADTGTQNMRIPYFTNGNMSAGNSANAGFVAIDSTNGRLCYWSGANRYYLAGTSF